MDLKTFLSRSLAFFGYALISLTFSCKDPSTEPNSESEVSALDTPLALEERVDAIGSNQCLIEFKSLFGDQDKAVKQIGAPGKPICIPSGAPEFAFRGRADVQIKKGPEPLSIAILVDNSGSLKNTDPGDPNSPEPIKTTGRYRGIQTLLEYFSKQYAGNFDKLRIGIFYFNYCLIPGRSTVFEGSTDEAFESWRNRFSMPNANGQTNYIHAMQYANHFLAEKKDAAWNKHMIVFSDGMPWTVGASISACKSSIASQATKLEQKGVESLDLEFDLSCTPTLPGTVGPNDNSCKTPMTGDAKGSSISPFPNTDPIDILVAMKQHTMFASRHIHGTETKVHTIYLNKKPCYEAKTTAELFPDLSKTLTHVCDDIAPNTFFAKLTDGKGLNLRAGNTEELETAFQQISESINRQVQFMSFKFYEVSEPEKAKVGVGCWQENGKVKCPLTADEKFEKALVDNESGVFNFHLPFTNFKNTGEVIVEAISEKEETYTFKVPYYFTYQASGCDYSNEEKKIGDKTRRTVKIDQDDFRITCANERKIGNSGCDDNGNLISDGGKRTVECADKDQCGKNIALEEICSNGSFVAEKSCQELKDAPCQSCSPNKWLAKSGTTGEEVSRVAFKLTADGQCKQGQQILRCEGDWQLISGAEFNLGACSLNDTCPATAEVPLIGVTNQLIILSEEETTACEVEKFTSLTRAYECTPSGWKTIPTNLATSLNCGRPNLVAKSCPATKEVSRTGIFAEVTGVVSFTSETATDCSKKAVTQKFRCGDNKKWIELDPLAKEVEAFASCKQVANVSCLEDPTLAGCSPEAINGKTVVFTQVADRSLPSGIANSTSPVTGIMKTTARGVDLD